jgi:hypothetical protein
LTSKTEEDEFNTAWMSYTKQSSIDQIHDNWYWLAYQLEPGARHLLGRTWGLDSPHLRRVLKRFCGRRAAAARLSLAHMPAASCAAPCYGLPVL